MRGIFCHITIESAVKLVPERAGCRPAGFTRWRASRSRTSGNSRSPGCRAVTDLPDVRRLGAVDLSVADDAFLVDQRVVRRGRARVAPVPVEQLDYVGCIRHAGQAHTWLVEIYGIAKDVTTNKSHQSNESEYRLLTKNDRKRRHGRHLTALTAFAAGMEGRDDDGRATVRAAWGRDVPARRNVGH